MGVRTNGWPRRTYLYMHGVPFPGSRARNQQSPQLVTGAKSHFSWCPVSGAFSGCFRRLQRRVLGLFWRALGPFSLGSEQQFLRDVRKCCLGVFLGEKSTRLVLQKHANRTVHPLKIEGVLPTVQRLLHMFQRPLFWFPKAGFGASKQYPTSMFFGT